jgi:hypothetical protein
MAKPWNELGRYGGVGLDLIVPAVLLGGLGHWLDQRYWGGGDWGFVGGLSLGVAAGVRNLIRATRRMQSDIERAEARDPEAHRWTVDETWLHKPHDGTHDGANDATKDQPDDPPAPPRT